MVTIYGIKNCNTMKRAFAWLDEHNIEYQFHDYKKHGISAEKLQQWHEQVGWEKLINKRGTTWKRLPEEDRSDVDQDKAFALMMEKTSMIKRPVIETENSILLGFDEAEYTETLS